MSIESNKYMADRKQFWIDNFKEYLQYFVLDENIITNVGSQQKILELYNEYKSNYSVDILEKIMKIYNNYYIIKLEELHTKISIFDIKGEFPEQLMTLMFLNKDNKVLEIGGNIGRNSMVIASIIDNNNYVVMECDKKNASDLLNNMKKNNFNFNIECSALSSNRMFQKGWNTITSDKELDGYTEVDTITLENLYNKYNINFDTLILDCEGAFYYILVEFPNILDNIKLVIIENDFKIEHEKFVKNRLIENGFKIVYCQNINSPYNWPYKFNFYEVYKKL
jgi:FkbM family methyltransferase